MKIGYIGLGKMGKNMVLRLLENNIEIVAWNRSRDPLDEVVAKGAMPATDFDNMVDQLRGEHKTNKVIIWLMLPAGEATELILSQLVPFLSTGDLVIDGANAFYKDTLRRAQELATKGIHYMDVAVSGGPSGARNGACLFVGGIKEDFEKVEELLKSIAAPNAYKYMGKSGAGHFAKMVHNGIEYGMMQAIAEGAAVLEKSDFDFKLADVFDLYNNRSVIESRLVGWAQEAFKENPTLEGISSTIAHSGEGEWTVQTATELGVPVPIIQESFNVRVQSANEPDNFRNKVVTALRGKFGGHATAIMKNK